VWTCSDRPVSQQDDMMRQAYCRCPWPTAAPRRSRCGPTSTRWRQSCGARQALASPLPGLRSIGVLVGL
jgi:hypothetical protein